MSEMIDRVANAISRSFHEEGYIEGVSDPSEWNEFLKAARAAIEAMREPTPPLLSALSDALDGPEVAARVERIWNGFIDAALKS